MGPAIQRGVDAGVRQGEVFAVHGRHPLDRDPQDIERAPQAAEPLGRAVEVDDVPAVVGVARLSAVTGGPRRWSDPPVPSRPRPAEPDRTGGR